MMLLAPTIKKNDRLARWAIFSVSAIVFITITLLSRFTLQVDLPFDVHYFALTNSIINSMVALLLIAGLYMVKQQNYIAHKKIMVMALILSVLFLVSYIAHHLFAGETRFGDVNHDGLVDDAEKSTVGNIRAVYYIILLTHIPLAGLILPLILFTAYRGLTAEYKRHKRLARITWPIWFYVAVSGVVVYWMISPYYP